MATRLTAFAPSSIFKKKSYSDSAFLWRRFQPRKNVNGSHFCFGIPIPTLHFSVLMRSLPLKIYCPHLVKSFIFLLSQNFYCFMSTRFITFVRSVMNKRVCEQTRRKIFFLRMSGEKAKVWMPQKSFFFPKKKMHGIY